MSSFASKITGHIIGLGQKLKVYSVEYSRKIFRQNNTISSFVSGITTAHILGLKAKTLVFISSNIRENFHKYSEMSGFFQESPDTTYILGLRQKL